MTGTPDHVSLTVYSLTDYTNAIYRDEKQMRAKANICELETQFLQNQFISNPTYRELQSMGWKFLVVDQTRGRCYLRDRTITIPKWALYTEKEGYLEYYVCHEMAHTFPRCLDHGSEFMFHFKRLCSEKYWHFELEYKPQNASAAGISQNKTVRTAKLVIDPIDLL